MAIATAREMKIRLRVKHTERFTDRKCVPPGNMRCMIDARSAGLPLGGAVEAVRA